MNHKECFAFMRCHIEQEALLSLHLIAALGSSSDFERIMPLDITEEQKLLQSRGDISTRRQMFEMRPDYELQAYAKMRGVPSGATTHLIHASPLSQRMIKGST